MDTLISRIDDVHLVQLRGRLDASSAGGLAAQLRPLAELPEPRIVLSFIELNSITSAGLRVVMQLAQRVSVAQGRLALCDLSGHVYEVFDMTGSLEFLPVFASRADALMHARA